MLRFAQAVRCAGRDRGSDAVASIKPENRLDTIWLYLRQGACDAVLPLRKGQLMKLLTTAPALAERVEAPTLSMREQGNAL